MSPQSAKTMVLVAGGLMFAAVALRRSSIPDPFRFAWAAGVITLFLSMLADVAPEVAGPAAILVLMAVYWRNRGVLGQLNPASAGVTISAPAGALGPVGVGLNSNPQLGAPQPPQTPAQGGKPMP